MTSYRSKAARCAKLCSSIGRRIVVAKRRRHAVGALADVVFELIAQVLRVGRVVFTFRIGIWEQRVARKRLYREGVGSVEIEILLESVRVEEIVADPAGGKRAEFARIEIELHALAGTEDDEAVVGLLQ